MFSKAQFYAKYKNNIENDIENDIIDIQKHEQSQIEVVSYLNKVSLFDKRSGDMITEN